MTSFWYRIIAILLSITIFSSCASVKPTENHKALVGWVDIFYVDAVNQLGMPEMVYEDGLNGRVLVYGEVVEIVNYNSLGNYDELFKDEVYKKVWVENLNRHTPTRIATSFDMLYVNNDGIIYSYQSNKSDREVRINHENGVIIGGVIIGVLTILLLVASE